mmetsp:Transcript_18417/g.32808  ORF Transcript_18417/g.32808 Transcript_18417/m.32808 type:complete len:203 (-) Transcript_18417:61-669(-)
MPRPCLSVRSRCCSSPSSRHCAVAPGVVMVPGAHAWPAVRWVLPRSCSLVRRRGRRGCGLLPKHWVTGAGLSATHAGARGVVTRRELHVRLHVHVRLLLHKARRARVRGATSLALSWASVLGAASCFRDVGHGGHTTHRRHTRLWRHPSHMKHHGMATHARLRMHVSHRWHARWHEGRVGWNSGWHLRHFPSARVHRRLGVP